LTSIHVHVCAGQRRADRSSRWRVPPGSRCSVLGAC
jgi:hypothetical protein